MLDSVWTTEANPWPLFAQPGIATLEIFFVGFGGSG
jgi:hypothetical protein